MIARSSPEEVLHVDIGFYPYNLITVCTCSSLDMLTDLVFKQDPCFVSLLCPMVCSLTQFGLTSVVRPGDCESLMVFSITETGNNVQGDGEPRFIKQSFHWGRHAVMFFRCDR